MANEPLLRQVVENIINDPASFDMSAWAKTTNCGTTMCIAGHTVVAAGYVLEFTAPFTSTSRIFPTDGSESEFIETLAEELLELTPYEKRMFFEMYWCEVMGRVSPGAGCLDAEKGVYDHYHEAASPRQVIENISRRTGFEFKIPDHIK